MCELIQHTCVSWSVAWDSFMTCVWDDMYCVRWHVLCEMAWGSSMTCIVWHVLCEMAYQLWCVGWLGHDQHTDNKMQHNTLFMVCWMTWSWPWSWPSRYDQLTHESPSWYDLLTHECPSHTWISQSIWTKSHVNVHRYVDRHSDDDTDDDIPMMIPMMTYQWWYQWWYCKICHTSG